MRSLPLEWTKGLSKEDKANFELLLRNSTSVSTKLVGLLEARLEESRKANKADYESPAWAYKQADRLGYERALMDIMALFNFLE